MTNKQEETWKWFDYAGATTVLILAFIGFAVVMFGTFDHVRDRIEDKIVAEERLETIESDIERAKYDIDSNYKSNLNSHTRYWNNIMDLNQSHCVDVLGGEDYYGGECHQE